MGLHGRDKVKVVFYVVGNYELHMSLVVLFTKKKKKKVQ